MLIKVNFHSCLSAVKVLTFTDLTQLCCSFFAVRLRHQRFPDIIISGSSWETPWSHRFTSTVFIGWHGKKQQSRESCSGTEVTLSSYPEESLTSEQDTDSLPAAVRIILTSWHLAINQERRTFKENTDAVLSQYSVPAESHHSATMLKNYSWNITLGRPMRIKWHQWYIFVFLLTLYFH